MTETVHFKMLEMIYFQIIGSLVAVSYAIVPSRM